MTRHHRLAEYGLGIEGPLVSSGIADADETIDAREIGEHTDMLTRARRRHHEAPAQTSNGPGTTASPDRKRTE